VILDTTTCQARSTSWMHTVQSAGGVT